MIPRPSSSTLRIYRVLAQLLIASIVVQVALAGLGAFGAVSWSWHQRFAVAVESIPLLMFLLAATGRLRAGLRWMPLLAVALVALQHLTATVGGAAGAVHAVNAFITFGLAMRMTTLATSVLDADDSGPARRRRRRGGAPATAATLLVAIALAGCSGGEDEATQGASADGSIVTVTNNEFTPETLTVGVGDTVTWSFEQGAHDVVFEDTGSQIETDGTWQRSFDEAGTYDYECTLHPGMTGRIDVA